MKELYNTLSPAYEMLHRIYIIQYNERLSVQQTVEAWNKLCRIHYYAERARF
jgi:hypothetical protein